MTTRTNTPDEHKLYYWNTLIALFVFSIVAGFWGFQDYFIQQGEDHNWLRILYRTLQLFVLEGGDISGQIPWALQASRFVAPLTAVMALVMALFEIFSERLKLIKISRMKNHVIIIGFGTKGKNVMEESLRKKEKVLIIENDPLNPNLPSIKSPGCRLLLGEANNKSILKRAGLIRAKSVFLLMRDDMQQISVCLLIYKLIRECPRNEQNALSCFMHLQKQEFLNILRNNKLVQDVHDGLILNIFNVYENSARELFENNPPDRDGIGVKSENYVQIIIFGFGQTGEALALQTALTGHYLNNKKPKVVIIDRLANERIPDFLKRYPTYQNFCDLDFLALDANSPQLVQQLVQYLGDQNAFTTIVLCFEIKMQNILLSLQLGNIRLKDTDPPLQVFVRTNDNETIITFTENIIPFGSPSKVYSPEVILKGDLDVKAKAVHECFLSMRKKKKDFGTRNADVPWENLSQEFKDSSRKSADHIGVKMRGIDCEIVSKDDPQSGVVFTQEEIEILAELEHRRWNAERSLAGWVYGKVKNEKIRKTPYLTDWKNLKDDIKEFDRETIRNIPNVLGLVNMKVVRKIKPQVKNSEKLIDNSTNSD